MDKIDALIEDRQLSWRDILYEVISGMDPWDINLGELATRYSTRVREMKEMNFRIPANVVLVSSVLLRMKADILNPHDPESYNELSESLNFMFGESLPEFPDLTDGAVEFDLELRPKRVPKRRITAVELIEAIQKVLDEKGAKKSRLLAKETKEGKTTLVIPPDIDLKALIEETYTKVVGLLGEKEVVCFSELAKTRYEVISVLMSLLHLWNNQRLHLRQEHIYDEIYIRSTPFLD